MGEWFAQSMTGSMLVALPIAVLAGAISFFSPCVVPLLPGYLSYVTGLSAAELGTAQARPDAGRDRACSCSASRPSSS